MLGSSTGDGTVLETPSGTEKGLENAGAGAATVTATADTGSLLNVSLGSHPSSRLKNGLKCSGNWGCTTVA